MEFRIAPMILVVFNFLFISLSNPEINTFIPLKELANLAKIILPFLMIFGLSIGTFIRHSYYSKTFKTVYFSFQIINVLMLFFYIYAVKSQHL